MTRVDEGWRVFVALVKSEIKIKKDVNYEKKVLQDGRKYPQNSTTSSFLSKTIFLSVNWLILNLLTRSAVVILTRSAVVILTRSTVKTVLQKNRLYLYLLQNGYKSPKNNLIDLIYNFTNAYCEILCFKNVLQNGCCHFDEIGRENCFTCFHCSSLP